MNLAATAALLALPLLAASPAFAVNLLVDFETPSSFESINQHYAGGTDSAGVAGPNLGVSFGSDALALRNDELGPYFSSAPSPLGVMTPVGSAAAMNVAVGFDALSLFYSSSAAVTNGVQIWGGLNGSGPLLASFSLARNGTTGGCSTSPLCNFSFLSAGGAGGFGGQIAYSATFGNAASFAVFDNINVSAVPEPGSALLLALGVAGLALARKRRG